MSLWMPHFLPDGSPWITGQTHRAIEIKDMHRFSAGRKGEEIVVLDRPYYVGRRVETKDGYYLAPLRLKDVPGWPPQIDAMGGRTLDPLPGQGEYARSTITRIGFMTVLGITFVYKSAEFEGTINSQSESLLTCIQATLKSNEGKLLIDLGNLELVGPK